MDRQVEIQREETRVTARIRWRTEDHRVARADALRLCAALEEATGAIQECWAIDVPPGVGLLGGGWSGAAVTLELAEGTRGEGERAERLLREAVDAWETP